MLKGLTRSSTETNGGTPLGDSIAIAILDFLVE